MVKYKHCWKGLFNFRHELKVLYCYAYTKEQARVVFCNRIAKGHGVHQSIVLNMFDGSKDNFRIEPETIFKEGDE